MLRPTDKELATAQQLGIDPVGMTGPKLREAIRKAQQPPTLPSLRQSERYKGIVHVADLLDIPVNPGTGVNTVKQGIEDCIMGLFEQKGIAPGVRVRFSQDCPGYACKEITIVNTTLVWFAHHVRVSVDSGAVKAHMMNAHTIALYANVI